MFNQTNTASVSRPKTFMAKQMIGQKKHVSQKQKQTYQIKWPHPLQETTLEQDHNLENIKLSQLIGQHQLK